MSRCVAGVRVQEGTQPEVSQEVEGAWITLTTLDASTTLSALHFCCWLYLHLGPAVEPVLVAETVHIPLLFESLCKIIHWHTVVVFVTEVSQVTL